MTVNTLTIELTCNGKTLKMGPGQDIDITAVSGLESSEVVHWKRNPTTCRLCLGGTFLSVKRLNYRQR